MPEPAVLLDLDGTLVDSLADIAASANHLRHHFGLPRVPEAQARAWVGDGALRLMQRALVEVGPFAEIHDEAFAVYTEHHDAQCVEHVRPYPGVEACLCAWRARGRCLAVVTNKPERFGERILQHLGLRAHFDACVYGDSTPWRKPDPRPLTRALAALGVPVTPQHALMVGDSVQDLRAGKAAGIRTAAALFGFQDEAALRAEGADEYWQRWPQG